MFEQIQRPASPLGAEAFEVRRQTPVQALDRRFAANASPLVDPSEADLYYPHRYIASDAVNWKYPNWQAILLESKMHQPASFTTDEGP